MRKNHLQALALIAGAFAPGLSCGVISTPVSRERAIIPDRAPIEPVIVTDPPILPDFRSMEILKEKTPADYERIRKAEEKRARKAARKAGAK